MSEKKSWIRPFNKDLHIIGWHDTEIVVKKLAFTNLQRHINNQLAGEIIGAWVNDYTFFLFNVLPRKFELIANHYFECTVISFSILQIWLPGIQHTVKYNRWYVRIKFSAVIWLKYCWYGINQYPTNHHWYTIHVMIQGRQHVPALSVHQLRTRIFPV